MSNIQKGKEFTTVEEALLAGLNSLPVSGEHETIAKTSATTFENRVEQGAGDVLGPSINIDGYIPQWDGKNSKTLKNGLSIDYFERSLPSTPINPLTNFLNGNKEWSIIPGGGDMVLADVQSVTGLKTFDKDKIAMKGTSTGVNILSVANTSGTSYTNILPAKDGTFAMISDIPVAGANTSLSNLSALAINTSLIPGGDVSVNLGTGDLRYKDAWIQTVSSGLTANDTLKLRGRDINATSYIDILTITSNDTVTADLNSITTIGGNVILYSGGALGTPSSGTVTNLTGTASININGTVGATTPTTGVFTTATITTIELGNASDTTISRVDAGVAAIEGKTILTTDNIEDSIVDGHTTIAPSGNAVYDALAGKEDTTNKVTSFQGTPDNSHYPSEKLVKDSLDAKAPTASPTFTGTVTLPTTEIGEASLKLDATLSEDEKWSGITVAGTAGATIAVGDVCYLASTGKWLLNDGILDGTDTGFSKQLGICLLAANDTDATEILLYGKVRSAAFPAFTVGSPVFLDDTAGDLTVTSPSTTNFAVRIVGFALSAEELMFNPSNDWAVNK